MSKNDKTKIRIIPRFIAHDFWRKFIALFFALLVWERVSARLDDNQTIRGIPVNLSIPGYVLIDDKPLDVAVMLKGPKNQLNKMTVNDINITITVKNPKDGVNKHLIEKKDIKIPKGISIASIEPSYLDLHLEEKMVKKVPVELKYTGALMEGYALNPIHIIPQEVTITGPKSIISITNDISTQLIPLSKTNVEDFDCRVKIDNQNKSISVNPQEISARIEIYKKNDTRTFKYLQIKPFGYSVQKGKLKINPQTTSITVEGAKNAIEIITIEQIRPFVDISDIGKTGEYTLNVQCWLNNKELKIKEIIPSTVNVTVGE